MNTFSLDTTPSQKGKITIVTGANDGIGYETALGLARKEAKVIMACRNRTKAEDAIARIKQEIPDADLVFIKLDLSDLASVHSFAKTFKRDFDRLDILINNAGIMIPPFSKTIDGFESQMGVNYFSHFLLTALLMDSLYLSEAARVISLSSIAHKTGKIDFGNLNAEIKYVKAKAYGQSKLACLMFAYELDRRLKRSGSKVISVASHPGVSVTNLLRYMSPILVKVVVPMIKPLFNSPARAALPSLMAALDPSVKGGDYIGPSGFQEMRGNPKIVKARSHAHDESVSKKLWKLSEKLVNFNFDL